MLYINNCIEATVAHWPFNVSIAIDWTINYATQREKESTRVSQDSIRGKISEQGACVNLEYPAFLSQHACAGRAPRRYGQA